MAKKPNLIAIKGIGSFNVSAEGEQEYLEALKSETDLIHICIKTTGFQDFPVMRKQLQPNDPAFFVKGGFSVKRKGNTRTFEISVDGIISNDDFKKKVMTAVSEGLATCKLEGIGTRENWRGIQDQEDYGSFDLSMAVAQE